jgi:hypothetical protein
MSNHDHPFHRDTPDQTARAVRDSIRAKSGTRPVVNNQGAIVGTPKLYSYDEYGGLVGEVTADYGDLTAEQAGLP